MPKRKRKGKKVMEKTRTREPTCRLLMPKDVVLQQQKLWVLQYYTCAPKKKIAGNTWKYVWKCAGNATHGEFSELYTTSDFRAPMSCQRHFHGKQHRDRR